MAQTITIGRAGNQAIPISDPHVSHKHAILTIDDNGKMHLVDNNSTNGTFVRMKNGSFKPYKELDVTQGMTLRFGPDFECKVKDLIPAPTPPPVSPVSPVSTIDITPLKYLEENYLREKVAIEQRLSTLGTLRMMVMVAGSAVTAMVGLLVKDNDMKLVIAVLPLLVAALGYFILIRMNNKVIRHRNDCDTNFKKNYVCPKCRMSFLGKVYTNIRVAGQCPNPKCNVKYTGEF